MSRQEGDRNGCCLLIAEMTRLWYHESSRGRRKSTEAGRGDGNDFIAYLKTLNVFPDSSNPASALSSQGYWVPWIDAHGIEHIPVIEPCCIDLNLDLSMAWFYASGRL